MIRKLFILLAVIVSAAYACGAQGRYKINLNASNTKATISSVDIVVNNTNICVSMHGKIIIAPNNNVNGQGDIVATYYDQFDGPNNIGKLKSIGDIAVTYYDQYDGFDNIGKLKSIGKIVFTYYDRFDGTDNPGKLKAIGNTKITYYDKYDGFDNIGKLKTVGNTTITYYDRFDTSEAPGTIKQISGNTPNLNIRRLQEFNADND
ncbi:hypothetical protein HDF18_16515 [Mucilaginibacter sp. X5P1]|uniref:hypothetical protein n=1 Tax=Mucilaginibacter sp. X5P1 TaxID=2723088 RepID=UPI0016221625|nr:hypothetical protein [Mucilaginibacter sp. X5P1]MBB6139234.1 hypothetical protein [Mucilaginibacter sp. X5P1]